MRVLVLEEYDGEREDELRLLLHLYVSDERHCDMFGGMAFNLPEIFEYAAGSFTDPKKADDLEQFFKEHPAKVAEKTCQQLVERIRSKAKLTASQFESVKNALKNK